MTETKSNRNNIVIEEDPRKSVNQQVADIHLGSILSSAEVILTYNANEQLQGTEAIISLKKKAKKIIGGNTEDMETILISQAVTLDTLFTRLSLRAHSNFGQYMKAAETYLRLALKAQSQCRATLETLAEIKNPRPYIQNNRAEYQQVNNGTGSNPKTNTPAHAHAGKTFSTNELLEDKTNEQEWLDTRTPTEAIRSD